MHQSSCWRVSSHAVRYRSTSSISSVTWFSSSSGSRVRCPPDCAAMATQLRERDRLPEDELLLVPRAAVLRGEVRAVVVDERFAAAAVRFDAGAVFLAGAFLAVDLLAGAFLAVDLLAGAFLAADFLAADFRAELWADFCADLWAGAFFAVDP